MYNKRYSTMNKVSTLKRNIFTVGIYMEHSITDIQSMRNIAMRNIHTEGRSIEQIHSNEKHIYIYIYIFSNEKMQQHGNQHSTSMRNIYTDGIYSKQIWQKRFNFNEKHIYR